MAEDLSTTMIAKVSELKQSTPTAKSLRSSSIEVAQNTQDILSASVYGVSFSILACRQYDIDWQQALSSTLSLGFRRVRLMSYWSLHESKKGVYDFSLLDAQISMVSAVGGRVTLAIGMRQPRWPETHLPEWVKELSRKEIVERYIAFHTAVVERYRTNATVESWQLENEFWLRSFGENFDYSRKRLKREFDIIRRLNPDRPIIMSLSNFGGLPMFKPTPDIFATSMYRVIYNSKKGYSRTKISPRQYAMKRWLIRVLRRRDMVIHELQAEPWGPKANWEMSIAEQDKSISAEQIEMAVKYAKESGIRYMDLWGAEWWYWRKTIHNDHAIETVLAQSIKANNS